MLFDRQKHLLSLLDALGGTVSALDFQKLLFLYCRAMKEPAPYDFVPYRFGAFSFTSYADKRRLIDQGLLENDEHSWSLSKKGGLEVRLNGNHQEHAARFVLSDGQLRGDKLIAETYRRFPYYAIRSEMAARLFARDKDALNRIRNSQPTPVKPGVRTIGYAERSLESYLNRLLRAGVTLLADVRRNPLSRKYGLSKKTLANACENVGIRYEHLPELGIASEERRDLHAQSDYDALFRSYERVTLPNQKEALAKICAWVNEGNVVALTCYEKLPEQCHRHCVASALERRYGPPFAPEHL